MSWAAHNPEAYDEILKSGVVTKLRKELADNGFCFEDAFDFLPAVVEVIFQAKDSKPFDALVTWAQHEVVNAEADYFVNLVDDARELEGQ